MIAFDQEPALDQLPAIRLPALPAPDVRRAAARLTMYAAEPRSTVTVALHVGGLTRGDIAGLALFHAVFHGRFAWLGVERADSFTLVRFDEQSGKTSRRPLHGPRVWLRADCDFVTNQVAFRFSRDGSRFAEIGERYPMREARDPARAVPCSLFSCSTEGEGNGGRADFDSFVIAAEPATGAHDEAALVCARSAAWTYAGAGPVESRSTSSGSMTNSRSSGAFPRFIRHSQIVRPI